MYSTYELYGIGPDKFKDKPYTEALDIKIKAGREHMKLLSSVAKSVMHDPDHYHALIKQYETTEKAIQFCRQLQEEIQDGNEFKED